MYAKFLLRFLLAVFLFMVIIYCIIIFISVKQFHYTLTLVDTQAMAALKAAARTCQVSVEDYKLTVSSGNIFNDHPEYYKFYREASGTFSSEYTLYLARLDNSSIFGDAFYNSLDILCNDGNAASNIDNAYGFIPMDFALPYVQLKSTGMSAANKDTIALSDGTTMEFDSDLASKVDQYLTQSISSSNSTFAKIKTDSDGIPDITVTLDDAYDSQEETLKCASGDKAAIIAKLGPVYKEGTSGAMYDDRDIGTYHVPYYDLKVNVEYTVNIEIPMFTLVGQTFPITVNRDYSIRYSLLN